MTSDGTRTISRLPVILVDMDFFLSLFKIFDILYPRCHGIGLSRQTAAQFHSNFLSYIKNIIPYAGEKEKKDTLSLLLAALKNKAIDKRADLTPEEETQVIMKEIKQTKETLELTPADRTDIIEECKKRLAVLEAYAPKMMDEDEIEAVIQATLAELGIDAPTGKDKGRIMKTLMPKVKGKADGKLVNQLLMKHMQ